MNRIESAFQKIYGKPCWNAKQGYASSLTFEFGDPHLSIREPKEVSEGTSVTVRRLFARRQVTVRGEWHLWIYCCDWFVSSKGKLIADSSATDRKIEKAMWELDGQALVRVSVEPDRGRSWFEFDLGGCLETRRWRKDRKREQWMLYEPSGYILSIRADGQYCHNRSDIPSERMPWRVMKTTNGKTKPVSHRVRE